MFYNFTFLETKFSTFEEKKRKEDPRVDGGRRRKHSVANNERFILCKLVPSGVYWAPVPRILPPHRALVTEKSFVPLMKRETQMRLGLNCEDRGGNPRDIRAPPLRLKAKLGNSARCTGFNRRSYAINAPYYIMNSHQTLPSSISFPFHISGLPFRIEIKWKHGGRWRNGAWEIVEFNIIFEESISIKIINIGRDIV